jgi:hypothetical protein
VKTALFASVVTLALAVSSAHAQSVPTFGGNAQHTGNYQPAARPWNSILWSTTTDLNPGAFAHYGAPLITAANTVIVPVKTATNGFELQAFNGATASGANPTPVYTLTTDYVLPSYNWIPVYQPVLAITSSSTRLYYAGTGGTIYYIDNPDSTTPDPPVQQAFYGEATYLANSAAFNSTVFINTPITADSNGNIFFGFRVQGTAPVPLNTTQSGFARIDPNGNGTYVLVGNAANDGNIVWDSHNSAPALSNDESTLYVVVKNGTDFADYAYLLGLDSTTLATKYKVFLIDPSNNGNAEVLDDGTASAMVAPDNDVYFGIYSGNSQNGSRGYLLHFSSDLTVTKTPGGFGWDYTAAIVPASMVPSYTGSSSYLIFSKYNNYDVPGSDGDGVNKVALLDPNATQIDPHPSANGLAEMREVLTVIGTTPDPEWYWQNIYAVHEWCINSAAVNPATMSVMFNSEDGHAYSWNLATNSLWQAATLDPGVGEPYVPSVIGPDGTVYTLNGGSLFALGGTAGVSVSLASSTPDMRVVIAGQSITFTVTVANAGSSGLIPTGTVTFTDTTFTGDSPVTSTLAANVALSGGQAVFSSSSLPAGSHFITASYSGDSNFSAGSATLAERIHTSASTTTVFSSENPSSLGDSVTFTATVSPTLSSNETPAMVTFVAGNTIIGQSSIINGQATISTSALPAGSNTITASFFSDTLYAASTSAPLTQVVQKGVGTLSTTTVRFGKVPVGSTASKAVTLTNTGKLPMSFGASPVSVSGPFTQTNNCTGALAPSASCTINVSFVPKSAGVLTGALIVTDDATNSPQAASLQGTGTQFRVSLSPTAVTVTRGQSTTSTVTVAPENGFIDAVSLSCQAPATKGITCSVMPAVIVLGSAQTATLTVQTSATTPRRQFSVTLKGKSGTLSHTATLTVTVD